mmetsp:Transcript_76964/g.249333  ORF Transcript_76964/g.249333 Transcript_76964/m.249333 type:complete len:238 (-) Transcript_76964:188-901(-)
MLSALHLCTLEARRHPVAVAAAEQIQRLPRGGQLLAVAVCGALVFSLLSALLNALYMLAMTLSFVFGGAYMASKAPSKESFEPAFERWFLEDYYPKVAPKLEQASLMGKLEQWLGVNTRQSGASWAYRFWASRCLPAGISDWLPTVSAWGSAHSDRRSVPRMPKPIVRSVSGESCHGDLCGRAQLLDVGSEGQHRFQQSLDPGREGDSMNERAGPLRPPCHAQSSPQRRRQWPTGRH